MADENAYPAECRMPTVEDVVTICRSLNQHGAKYLVVGGFAILQHGYSRTTADLDLVVEASLENQAKVKAALTVLPEKAILELGDEDMRDYVVVRVVDEVLVDVMLAACGIEYAEAAKHIRTFEVGGVPIPFASPQLLLRMKQTHREKDVSDRIFLHRKIAEMEGRAVPEAPLEE